MQHVVRFTTAEGREGTHFSDSLEDAVSFVERVRNVEQATDVRLFSMTEVPVSFRTYYQVQVGESQPTPPPVRASVAAQVAASPVLDAHVPQPHATESSVLDAADHEAPASVAADHQQTAADHQQTAADHQQAASAAESHHQDPAVDSDTPPLETRFGDQGTESAPANGRRLFSRA